MATKNRSDVDKHPNHLGLAELHDGLPPEPLEVPDRPLRTPRQVRDLWPYDVGGFAEASGRQGF